MELFLHARGNSVADVTFILSKMTIFVGTLNTNYYAVHFINTGIIKRSDGLNAYASLLPFIGRGGWGGGGYDGHLTEM